MWEIDIILYAMKLARLRYDFCSIYILKTVVLDDKYIIIISSALSV